MSECRKGEGNPNATTIHESKKILKFAGGNRKDVFYDIGCGYGTPCIVAARHFNMKKVVGIEVCKANYLEAVRRIIKKRLTDKIWLWHSFVENTNFSDATLVYCVIEPSLEIIKQFQKTLKPPCRLITSFMPLPSIKPSKLLELPSGDLYLMKTPLNKYKANNPDEWACSLRKGYSDFKDLCDDLDKRDKRWIKNIMRQIYGKNCLSRP